MSRHTPGPWARWRGDLVRAPILHRENCSQVVARTNTPWLAPEPGETDADLYTRAQVEQSANARLIAAAPTLLAACREAVASCRCRGTGKVDLGCRVCGDSTYEHDCEEVMRDCQHCKGLHAAIAAATTEEQGHG